jgi:endosialidase-like protein
MAEVKTKLIQMTTSNATAFRATYPIDFDLFDKDSQNVLYIEDSSDQLLTLEIRNASNNDIVLKDLAGAPLSATNYHFALRFRPGTLAQTSLGGTKIIQLTSSSAKDNWEMLQTQHNSENWDVIYLRKLLGHTLKCATESEKAPWQSVVFNHVGADAGRGARGTRVELVCTNMNFQGSAEPINTIREIHLGIINHRGKKTIPLQMGFVGGNTVVNNGIPQDPLTLRIANIAPYNLLNQTQSNITFKYDDKDVTKTTQLYLSFQSGKDNDPWALDTDAIIKSIDIVQPAGWLLIPPKQDGKPVWILSPNKETITLQSMEDPANNKITHFDIVIKNIISHFPCGQTHLYIYYQNIPGYWDGNMVCMIEKTPIKVQQGLVEIDSDLSIKNGSTEIVRVTKEDLNVQTTLSCRGLLQINGDGENYIDISTLNGQVKYMRIGTYMSANNIENYDRPLVINHTGTDKKTTELARITKDGKMGIGIPAPAARVDIAVSTDIPALQVNNGNISNGTNLNQIALAYNDSKDGYRHVIKSRHDGNDGQGNAIDFYVWDKGKDPVTTIGTKHTLSLNNGKVGIGGITDPAESLEVNGNIIAAGLQVKGFIISEVPGTNTYAPGLTVSNGRIWSNFINGGLLVGPKQEGFFGMAGDRGVGIWHQGDGRPNGDWGITIKQPAYPSDALNEVTVNGKLYIKVVDQLQEKSTKYMVHKPSNDEIGWWDTSDQHLKKNISTIPLALEAIQQLRGVSFEWNDKGLLHKTKDVTETYRTASNTREDNSKLWEQEKQRIYQENARSFRGFIAQEVEAVFPDWVKEDKDGYKTINMDELAPVMVEAIKDQQQQINTLQEQINHLMKEVKALKSHNF